MGLAQEAEALTPASPRKPRFWAQFLASVGASLAVASWAAGIGVGSVCVDQLSLGIGGFNLSPNQQVWIVTSHFIGTVVGSAVAGKLSSWYGARNVMLALSIPCFVGFGLTALATNYEALLIGRLTVGVSSGPAFVLHVFFISATASPKYRGILALIPDLVYMVYVIACILFGIYLPWWWTSLAAGVISLVPTLILLVVVPSDPIWLLKKGRLDEAKRAANFYGLDLPLEALERPISAEKKRALLRMRENYRPIIVSAVMLLLVAFCGYLAILGYSLVFFKDSGFSLDPNSCSILLCLIRMFTVLGASAFVDRLGRRSLLLFSALGMMISYLLVAAYFYVPALEQYHQLPLICILLAVFFFCIGVGPVPWVLIGEIIAPSLRDFAGTILILHYNLASFVQLQIFPDMLRVLGTGGTFLVYAGVMALFIVLVAAMLPETRGLELSDIPQLFKKRRKDGSLVLVEKLPPVTYDTFVTVSTIGG